MGDIPSADVEALLAERFAQVFEQAPLLYVMTRQQGGVAVIEHGNGLFLRSLGYEALEVEGIPLSRFYTTASASQLAQGGYLRALEGRFAQEERQLVCKDGSVLDALLSAVPRMDASGTLVGTHVFFIDITASKQAEKDTRVKLALQRLRNEILRMEGEQDWERLARCFDAELGGLVDYSRWSISLVEGGQVRQYFEHGEQFRAVVKDRVPPAIEEAMATGKCVYRRSREAMVRMADHSKLLEMGIQSAVDVPFSRGTIAVSSTRPEAFTEADLRVLEEFAGVMSEAHRRLGDLQELAAKDQQLRQAQKLETVGQLASGVAHDFNNILTVQLGYCALLRKKLDPADPVAKGLAHIRTSAERAASLTRQLLAFSRVQTLQPEVLDPNAVVMGFEKMLRRLIGEDIDLVTTLAEDVGRVHADPGQIEQVVMNLAVNARDAMPQGGRLTIETANVAVGEAYARTHVGAHVGPYVLLAISDTGCGMDEETQKRLFEPFFTTKEKGRGTGLGLATVYGIVKQSGGNIWVYSEPDQGTVFKIYLPRVEAEVLQRSRPEVRAIQGRGELVLVVEDEPALRELSAMMVEDLGSQVRAVANGAEALTVCEQGGLRPDLLFTDVVLPGMSGRVLAERLSQVQAGLKVLYTSGYTDDPIVYHGVLEPGIPFLQKPFTAEGLAGKIRDVLDSGQGTAGPGPSVGRTVVASAGAGHVAGRLLMPDRCGSGRMDRRRAPWGRSPSLFLKARRSANRRGV